MFVKRGVDTIVVSYSIIPSSFESRGWIDLFVAPMFANRDMVKDFHETTEDSEHFTKYTRGVLFEFSIDLIASTLHLARVARDAYHLRPESALPSLSTIATVLHGVPYPNG